VNRHDDRGHDDRSEKRRATQAPAPVPVVLRSRAFPAIPPPEVHEPIPFPERILLAEAVAGPDGRAISGVYLGDGPDMGELVGRFRGPAASEGFDPSGPGPLRDLDDFLDRLIWRLIYKSRFGFVSWKPASFFCSLACTFRKDGTWAILWTNPNPAGGRWIDYYRTPVVLEAQSDGRVLVHFGPRKNPDPRDFDASGRQYPGAFAYLQDAISALAGERVEDLATACRLFDIDPPPPGPAIIATLPVRITAMRQLYRAVRAEAESWPGVTLDRLSSPAAVVSGAYLSADIPQPLLRGRPTMHVPGRAIGAGIEAASIGARTGLFARRVAVPGLDVDITACYPVGNVLAGVQDFLTREVRAHHLSAPRSLAELTCGVAAAVSAGLLDHPEKWPSLAFLCKVRPRDDVLTAHVDLFGTEGTVTAPIVAGSKEFWTTGFDLAVAAIEDLHRGGAGRIPEIVEAWTFTFGPRLRGLQPVSFPRGWTWDPRRPTTYRSRDGRTWGNLYLLLAAMRLAAKSDPGLTAAERFRRRGVLKIASVAGAFGMFAATVPLSHPKPGTPHRVVIADGIITLDHETPERPGAWAFPPGAALVEGTGRLLLTLLMHEVRIRGGAMVQVDTDGGFIAATCEGELIDVEGEALRALSFAQVQEVRDRFQRIARWTGLPILPDRIEGGRLVKCHEPPSLLKVEDTMVGPEGRLGDYRCYAPGLRRFGIFPADGSTDGLWRVSENTIGAMVNPTSLRPQEFAKECYRYLLAREAGERFLARWLDEPVLYPKVLTHPADLARARRAIPDIRPTETIVYARDLFGSCSYIARMIPGVHWDRLEWRTVGGEAVPLVPAKGRAAGTVRTWRIFLNRNTFLRHPVPFTLRADGRRSDGETRGLLAPAPILIVGATRTGRTGWASGPTARRTDPRSGRVGACGWRPGRCSRRRVAARRARSAKREGLAGWPSPSQARRPDSPSPGCRPGASGGRPCAISHSGLHRAGLHRAPDREAAPLLSPSRYLSGGPT
jgi:hypothetical protein